VTGKKNRKGEGGEGDHVLALIPHSFLINPLDRGKKLKGKKKERSGVSPRQARFDGRGGWEETVEKKKRRKKRISLNNHNLLLLTYIYVSSLPRGKNLRRTRGGKRRNSQPGCVGLTAIV